MSLEQPSRWAFQFAFLMRVLAGPMADWLQVMLHMFVFIYEVLPKPTYKELWGCTGVIQHWVLFIEKLEGVYCKCANGVTSALLNISQEMKRLYLASNMREEEQCPTFTKNNSLCLILWCVHLCVCVRTKTKLSSITLYTSYTIICSHTKYCKIQFREDGKTFVCV